MTSVHPGGIKTRIAHNARHATEGDAELFLKIAMTTARSCARTILRGVERNQERVFVGVDAKMMALARRAIPALAVRAAGAITRGL